MIDIEKLKLAALTATRGEWDTDGFTSIGSTLNDQANGGYFICHCEGPDKLANTTFIATASPSAVLELITRLEAAKSQLASQELVIQQLREALAIQPSPEILQARDVHVAEACAVQATNWGVRHEN